MVRNNYHNCFMMALMSLLKKKKINTDPLISNLNVRIKKDNELLTVVTDDLEYLDQLQRDFDIQVTSNKYAEFESFDELVNQIDRYEDCIAMVDIFHLPYCIYHNKEHEKHSVHIEKAESPSTYTLYDYYYGHVGQFSEDQLRDILESSNKTIKNGISIFFNKHVGSNPSAAGFKVVLSRNIEYYEQPGADDVLHGLAAMELLLDYLKEVREDVMSSQYLEALYGPIKDIAMYREGFSRFAKAFELNELYAVSRKCAQQWLILGNLLLLSSVKRDYELKRERISKRMAAILCSEKEMLSISKRIVQEIS